MKIKNTCPCCKITNCLTEAKRHPSVTTYFSLMNAVKNFSLLSVEQQIPLIQDCEHHADKERLSNWFDVIYKDALERVRTGVAVRHLPGSPFGSPR